MSWKLYGVNSVDGELFDTLIGTFGTREEMMKFRKESGVDPEYDYIEYGEDHG